MVRLRFDHEAYYVIYGHRGRVNLWKDQLFRLEGVYAPFVEAGVFNLDLSYTEDGKALDELARLGRDVEHEDPPLADKSVLWRPTAIDNDLFDFI